MYLKIKQQRKYFKLKEKSEECMNTVIYTLLLAVKINGGFYLDLTDLKFTHGFFSLGYI
jgi:hypothetical protein